MNSVFSCVYLARRRGFQGKCPEAALSIGYLVIIYTQLANYKVACHLPNENPIQLDQWINISTMTITLKSQFGSVSCSL